MLGQEMTPTERLAHLWLVTFGVTGDNGLNGTAKKHSSEIDAIRAELRRYELIEAKVAMLGKALQWAGMVIGAVAAGLLTTPVGTFVGNIIRAGSGQ